MITPMNIYAPMPTTPTPSPILFPCFLTSLEEKIISGCGISLSQLDSSFPLDHHISSNILYISITLSLYPKNLSLPYLLISWQLPINLRNEKIGDWDAFAVVDVDENKNIQQIMLMSIIDIPRTSKERRILIHIR